MLIPAFLLLLLLMLQPVCLLYTRSVMESTATETARLLATGDADGDEAYRSFALRRLAAIPDLSIFHAGGPLAWDIELTRAPAAEGEVEVVIAGAVCPLPILGAFAATMGETNAQGDILMRVSVSYEARPEWLEGDYALWIEAWNE